MVRTVRVQSMKNLIARALGTGALAAFGVAIAVASADAAADESLSERASPQPQLQLADGSEIVLRALGLLGRPYRFGGSDPQHGFDCSGLVRHVFHAVRGQILPRRSNQIGRLGEPVAPDALAVGDLVFFNTLGDAYSHVAIYIGDRRFVHAPAQRGLVRIETMDEPYWRGRYDGARRIGADLNRGAPASQTLQWASEPAERERGQ